MELGNKIVTRFFGFFLLGIASVMLAMGLTLFDGPYRYGRFGFVFWPLHAMSAVALLYAGVFGLMASGATEISSTRLKMRVAWGMFGAIGLLYLGAIYVIAAQLMPVTTPPNWADYGMAGLVDITAVVAAYAYVVACRYFLRVHRLRAPYLRQKREIDDLRGEE